MRLQIYDLVSRTYPASECESDKHILINFLNAVLELDGLDKIKEVSFEEKQLDVTLLTSEKLSISDLHVITESGILIYERISN